MAREQIPGPTRARNIGIAVIGLGGVVALIVAGSWDNTMFIQAHTSPSLRLDRVLDERAWELVWRQVWIWCAMAALTFPLVRPPRRVQKLIWILLAHLVVLSIATSVVGFKFVRDWAVR